MITKICAKCKENKLLENFTKDKYSKDGFTTQCKVCRRKLTANWTKGLELKNIIIPIEKKCNSCQKMLVNNLFYKDRSKKTGLDSNCKNCSNKYDRERNKQKPELRRAREKRYRTKYPEKYKQKTKHFRNTHKQYLKQIMHDWQSKNREKVNEMCRRRDANKKRATPSWANIENMRQIYKQAEEITKQTGIPHHVDHIVPLTSLIVQGLHCEYNLQILPAQDNIRKHNKYWPDMP